MTVAHHEPPADTIGGGLVPVLDPHAARQLTDRIATLMHEMHPLVFRAWREQAWRALGYTTWAAYCRAEFQTDRLRIPADDRAAIARAWTAEGMSLRDVGAGVGYSEGAIRIALGRDPEASTPGRLQQSRRSTPLTARLEAALLKAGPEGLIVKEVTRRFHVHHGQGSSALSALWAQRRAEHLVERRQGCGVYVHPDHVEGRDVRVRRDQPHR